MEKIKTLPPTNCFDAEQNILLSTDQHNKLMKIALDWTPNPIHCGTFTALNKMWFTKAGIHIEIVSPTEDGYALSPAMKVKQGKTHLAIVPPEELVLDQLKGENKLLPLRALIQQNATSIAVLASSNICRPADLDGKKYALLNLPWEREVITTMVKNDGGKGDIIWIEPPKLEIYDLLFEGIADCAWIFEPIEGVEAGYRNIPLRTFKLEDYGIPYGPTTILVTNPTTYEINKEEIDLTLSIMEAGYSLAHMEPETAAKAIFEHPLNSHYKEYALLLASQKAVTPYLNENGVWGKINQERYLVYLDWLKSNFIKNPLVVI